MGVNWSTDVVLAISIACRFLGIEYGTALPKQTVKKNL